MLAETDVRGFLVVETGAGTTGALTTGGDGTTGALTTGAAVGSVLTLATILG